MPSSCNVCNHPDRAEIEAAIMNMSLDGPADDRFTIERIAEQYEVDLDELKMHALFHTPLAVDVPRATEPGVAVEVEAPRDSLTRKMKLREADMLAAMGTEYVVTLTTMGRRINRLAQIGPNDVEDDEKQLKLAKLLTKPMVELYLGVGAEIRHTVELMAKLDRMINGQDDSLSTGIAALAAAIKGSDSCD